MARSAAREILAVTILCTSTLLLGVCAATPGELDPSFGSGGAVTTNFGWDAGSSLARTVLQQADGKLVVAGTGTNGDVGFGLARYNLDGSLDNSFGDGGRVVTLIGGPQFVWDDFDNGVYGLVQQSDGKLVAAGRAPNVVGAADIGLVRYQTDGSLDLTFGDNGITTTNLTYYDYVEALALQSDGKIVVAGGSIQNGFDIMVARYESDGSLDSSFGAGGVVLVDLDGGEYGYDIAITGEGKIAVAGSSNDTVVLLVLLNADGTLDAGFGDSGVASTEIAGSYARAYGLVQQSDGKWVVAGDLSGGGGESDHLVLRYDTAGILDNSFATGGIAITPLGSGNDYGRAIIRQPDGRLVAAGFSFDGSGSDFAAVRYNNDGTLDSQFGTNGIVLTDIGGTADQANGLAIQTDGKLLIAGLLGAAEYEFALARLDTDGSLDTSFGTSGLVTTTVSSRYDAATAVTVQYDGRVVAVGRSGTNNGDAIAMARYNSDGTLDSGFGDSGTVITSFGGGHDAAVGVVQQSSGKLVLAATTRIGGVHQFALVRYATDGSLDTAFGNAGLVSTSTGGQATAADLVQQSDGKLVIGGTTQGGFGLIRYDADGELDASFGNAGVVVSPGPGAMVALLEQTDGKLVAAGTGAGYFAISRYNPDGTLDLGFGSTGQLFISSSQTGHQIFRDVIQQSDGKLVGAGADAFVRLETDGGLDGVYPVSISQYAAVQLADEKLLGAGSAPLQPFGAAWHFALTRHETSGEVDPTFGTQGQSVTPLAGLMSSISALRVQADTKLIAVGSSDSDFAVARYFTQLCGNGLLDIGEECDDGNVKDGDCCAAGCLAEPDGPASCDGNLCTRADTCATGICLAGPCATGEACSGCGGTCKNGPSGCECNY